MKTDFQMRLFIFLLACTVSLCPAGIAHAQNQSPIPHNASAKAQEISGISTPSMPDPEVTIMRDAYAGRYTPTTLVNLSQLYWRLGAFDIGDDKAISGYIRIHECKLYREYGYDEFEWGKIVDAMREHLRENKDHFSLSYQVLLPVELGIYDDEKLGFPLVNDTGFINTKRIEVDFEDSKNVNCANNTLLVNYPLKIMVWFSQPFNFDFLNMDEHVAQAFIVRRKQAGGPKSPRTVYIRIRLQVSRYEGNVVLQKKGILAVLRGKIDGYDVFEDMEQKRLMSSVNLDQNTVRVPTMTIPPSQIKDSMIESVKKTDSNAAAP